MSFVKPSEMLPAGPLEAEVRLWCRVYDLDVNRDPKHEKAGASALAQRFADRHDIKLTTAIRQIQRILTHETATVSVEYIDKMCVVLGTHPILVYGSAWEPEEVYAR